MKMLIKYLMSLDCLSFDLVESDFKIFELEQAKEGGALDFGVSVDYPDDLPKVTAPFELEFIFEMNGYQRLEGDERKKLFDLKQKFTANFIPFDSDVFFGEDSATQLQHCVNLIYPFIRESVLQNLRVSGLSIIEMPLTFIDVIDRNQQQE